MNIQAGEIYMDKVTNQHTLYPNKTRKYLLPCLQEYGGVFIKKLEGVDKIAVGIGDIVVSNRGIKLEKHIFILIDTKKKPKTFVSFLEWVREQDYFQDDYVFNSIQKTNSHMIIIKMPEKFYGAFESFKLGEYSKMYTTDTINRFFLRNSNVTRVLIKDHNYKVVFAKKLNERYKSSVEPHEIEGELEFKPKLSNEIFNYHLKKKT